MARWRARSRRSCTGGALLLAIHDGLASIRAGMALFDLPRPRSWSRWCGGSRAAWLAAGSGLVALLLPWTLHEHAQLTPETLGAPLCSARRCCRAGAAAWPRGARRARRGLQARLRAAGAADRAGRRAAAARARVAGGLRRRARARRHGRVRHRPLARGRGGAAAGRVACAPLRRCGRRRRGTSRRSRCRRAAVVLRERAREPRLVITTAAAAIGSLVLVATVYKNGTYLNVVQLAEAPLLSLRGRAAWLVDMRAAPALAVGAASRCSAPRRWHRCWRRRTTRARSPARSRRALPAASSPGVRRATDAHARRRRRVSVRPTSHSCEAPHASHQPDQFIIANAREDARFAAPRRSARARSSR